MAAHGLARDLELQELDPLFSDDRPIVEALQSKVLARLSEIRDPDSPYAQSLVDNAIGYDRILRGEIPEGELAAGAFAELERSLSSYQKRRNQESTLARHLLVMAEEKGDDELEAIADSMARCHYAAPVMYCEEKGEFRYQWDHKCHQSKLCPHEARAASAEFIEKYTPLILYLLATIKGARLQYWVVSPPHIEAADLAEKKRALFGWLGRKLARLRREKIIVGALVTQEDPVAIGGELFNVHFNVLVVTRGRPPFDYLRNEIFKCMTHFTDERGMIERTSKSMRRRGSHPDGFTKTDVLRTAITELVKYAAKLVGADDKHTPHSVKTKGEQAKQAAGAPPMVEWSPDIFFCWWDANRSFNRVRPFGVLNAQVKIRTDNDRDNPDPVELRQAARAYGTPPMVSLPVLGARLRKALDDLEWSDMQLAGALDRELGGGVFRAYVRLLDWLPTKTETYPDGSPKSTGRRRKPRETPPTPPGARERRALCSVLKKTELALFHHRGVCVRDLVDPPEARTPIEEFIQVGHVEWNQALGGYRPLILIKAVKSHQKNAGATAGKSDFDARAGPDPPVIVYESAGR